VINLDADLLAERLHIAGDLRTRRAVFVYEAGRYHAAAGGSHVVPEPWNQRDEAFREQFIQTVEMMCGPDRTDDAAELHEDWCKAYEKMGWRYGPKRDPVSKTHPDMVPFDDLAQKERDKDFAFVALCEIARCFILDYDVDVS
jgi:hypothetical protein